MLDKTAIIKEAQKHLAKGAIDKAIAELERLVKESPDGTTYNMIGDLYHKKNSQKSATEFYQKAANYFREEGFTQKAQALYKKVLNINPVDTDALYAFGELSEEKGLTTDAIKYYLATADLLMKEGKKDRILEIYEKILSLSPANIPLRIKVAEIFLREGLRSDAAREYLRIARIHDDKGDYAKSKEFYQKTFELQPQNKDAALGLSHLYEKTGDVDTALSQMKDATVLFPDDADILFRCTELSLLANDSGSAKQCLIRITEQDPQNTKAHRMLGELYLAAGAKEKAWEQYLPVLDGILTDMNYEEAISLLESFRPVDPVETGKKLISLHRQLEEKERVCEELVLLGDHYAAQGMEDEARSCFTDALEADPGHAAAQARLAPPPPAPEQEPEPEMASEPPGYAAGEIEIEGLTLPQEGPGQELDITSGERETGAPPDTLDFASTATQTAQDHINIRGEKSFDEVMTEVDIFSRYGLLNEAQKLLEGLKTRFPENIDVHIRLKSLYTDIQEKELAVTECIILGELYKRQGDQAAAEQVMKEASEISPDDARLSERGFAQFIEPTSFAEQALDSMRAAEAGAAPDIEDYEEDIAEADFYSRQGLTTEAIKILEKLLKLFPDNRSIIERLQSLGQTGSPVESLDLSDETSFSDTFDQLIGQEEESTLTFSGAESFEVSPGPAVEDEGLTVPDLEEPAGEFGTGTEEAAGSVSEEQLTGEPSPEMMPQEEVETPDEQQEVPREEPAPEFEDFSLLDDEMVDAQEMPEPTLDNDVLEVFQEFKKGLEKELGEEDSETHYNLGIAYKEMGLVDDAIKEFQTSRNDPKRSLQSSTMLGVCYMEKGLYGLAVDVLAEARDAMKEKDESYYALSYELAEALEKYRKLDKALEIYTQVYGWNAKFRQVSDKMGQLQSAAGKSPEADRGPAAEKPKERKDRVSYL